MKLSLTKHINEQHELLEIFDSTKIGKVGDVSTAFDISLGGNKSIKYSVWIGDDETHPKMLSMIKKYMDKHGIDEARGMSLKEIKKWVSDVAFAIEEISGFPPEELGQGGVKIGKNKWSLNYIDTVVGINSVKHSLKVFGHVFKIVQKWVAKFHEVSAGLAFYADVNIPSRVKLYRRMSKTLASKLNMRYIGGTKSD